MTLPRQPALSPWCRRVDDGNRVLLERGGTVVTLEGRAAETLLPRLLPLLDGSRTLDELASELGPAIAPAIRQALSLLDEHQLLVDGEVGSDGASELTAAAAYAVTVSRRATLAQVVSALRNATVTVVGGSTGAAEIASILERSGVGLVQRRELDGDADGFVVAVPAPDETSGLDRINERALADETPWLSLLPFDGRLVVVGPLYLPGSSACRRCFVLRRAACSGYEDDFDLVERRPVPAHAPPALVSIAAGVAATIVLRWITAADPTLPGWFYAIESRSPLEVTHQHVLRVPRCPACGPPQAAVASPWFEVTP